jgi:hypothetical protein
MFKGFVGRPHMDAIISVVNGNDLPVLLEELCNFLESKVNYELSSYSSALLDALDPMKLPSMKFGVVGGYGYFDLKLKPIARYNLLRPNVFHALRIIGNSFAFLKCFDACIEVKGALNSIFISFFDGLSLPKDDSSSTTIDQNSEKSAIKILRKGLSFTGNQNKDLVSF